MVSVIIPTFNREKTIARAVNSVLNQTYRDLEVIVVDDGSTDNTREVIDGIIDSRLHYYYQNNAGACAARNRGIELSRGDFIAFQDSDDEWRPEKLSRQLDVIKADNPDILFCQILRVNEVPEPVKLPALQKSGFVQQNDVMVGISTQTLIMKRAVAQAVQFDPKMPRFQDLDWIIRATDEYTLYGMNEVLVNSYYSHDSISLSSIKMYRAIRLMFCKYPYLQNDFPYVYSSLKTILRYEAEAKRERGEHDCYKYYKLSSTHSEPPKERIEWMIAGLGLDRLQKKIRGGVRCYREHGLRYTAQRFVDHITGRS